MDFSLSESQKAFREQVLEFAEEALDADVQGLDKAGEFNRAGWHRCAEFGIQGGLVPEEFGGRGLELMSYIAGLEALGWACGDTGLLFAICAHVFACELPILTYGTEEQKKLWLPDLCTGKRVAAIAIAEEHGASDAFNLCTTAREDGDTYVINGRKSYVTNAPFCDLALVFAASEGDPDKIVCLVVEAGNPGMELCEATEKMGFRTSPFGDVILTDCRVSKTNLLGKPSSGKMVFMTAMEWERGCLLAPMVGLMQRQVERCADRVRSRKQNGAPLSAHQAVAHRVVDMKVRTEIAHTMLHRFAWKKQTRRRAGMEAAVTKLCISEAFVQNSLDAVQLFGAHGYTCEPGIERQLRDAVGTRLASGTSDIQKNIIAKWLKL